jgi:quercetin 2,3-dioxygenase
MLQLRPKATLDHGDRGWLKARHHFVVSADGNKANSALGALVVWNDDEIAPGKNRDPLGLGCWPAA